MTSCLFIPDFPLEAQRGTAAGPTLANMQEKKWKLHLNRKASLKELPPPGPLYWQNVLLFGAFISLVQTHKNSLQKKNRLTRLRMAIDQNPELKLLGSMKYVDMDRASN